MRTIVLLIVCAAILNARNLTPAWVELGPDGDSLVRVVVEAGDACPALTADGAPVPMQRREPVPEGFQPACEAVLPRNAHNLKLGSQRLRRPVDPSSVVVFGDSGCRVSATELQACNDPAAWPLRRNAHRISRSKPDLIIHVGDYLYRESTCPDPKEGCAGPHGDNWAAWNADFFEPAKEALEAAPWVFTRGNHESCQRSWRGWFYYLDPRPFTGQCGQKESLTDAWIAESGALRIGVLDSSRILTTDTESAGYVPQFVAQLERLSGHVDWVTVHHPVSAYSPAANGPVSGTKPLWAAWQRAKPAGIQLIVSGHTHLFEFLAFGHSRTSQLVAGTGGTNLESGSLGPKFAGQELNGVPVTGGGSRKQFGYTRLRRVGGQWSLDLIDLNGAPAFSCVLTATDGARCGN